MLTQVLKDWPTGNIGIQKCPSVPGLCVFQLSLLFPQSCLVLIGIRRLTKKAFGRSEFKKHKIINNIHCNKNYLFPVFGFAYQRKRRYAGARRTAPTSWFTANIFWKVQKMDLQHFPSLTKPISPIEKMLVLDFKYSSDVFGYRDRLYRGLQILFQRRICLRMPNSRNATSTLSVQTLIDVCSSIHLQQSCRI